jgi:hypothetical protein
METYWNSSAKRLQKTTLQNGSEAPHMGKNDSSKTRVRPIFRALYESGQSGSWVDELLLMGASRPFASVGHLTDPPHFEFLAVPPKQFLRWLVENPQKWPTNWEAIKMRNEILEARRRLARGEPAKSKALEAIDLASTLSSDYSGWWCLEGPSRVDCALFAENAVIFIEGKRTEREPSKTTTFCANRNQMARNLDCARRYGHDNGLDYYAMLVIEQGNSSRTSAAKKIAGQLALSLPHLSPSELQETEQHYLGFTTWKDIVDRFRLPPSLIA